MCGEYGEELGRPHFHAAIFNFSFRDDRTPWRRSESGDQCFRSQRLEGLWKLGHSEVNELSPELAAYVARYIMKKVNGDQADEHYRVLDVNTGELTWKVPEFTHMSLRPGIGGHWFDKFMSDVYPADRVVARGVLSKPPRYYDRRLRMIDAEMLQLIQEERVRQAKARFADSSTDRLAVREAVAKARLSFFKRRLK